MVELLGTNTPMQEQPTATPVRAFTSYSWSSPTHEAWVIQLASRLREDGVDVILDKWDLKPGHDSYQFMESMVTDKTVTKVMMICDKTYVEKANNRSGGVGTESQIISPELYGKGTQDKFAALMTDEDDDGDAHIPVFYKGRIYFDFRSADKFEDSYEQLLRWLVDRPQHSKPKLGSVPESILNAAPVATATQSKARRAMEAVRLGSNSTTGLVREYGQALYLELRALAPRESEVEPFDETIVKAIEAMRPYLHQWSDLVGATVRFGEDTRVWDRILGVNEQLGTLMYRDPEITRWNSHQFDAFKVVAHDAFLITIAMALEEERFDLVEIALKKPYLVQEYEGGGNRPTTTDFTVFRQYTQSLDHRNQRLKLSRLSVDADLLKEAHPKGSIPSFESLMQADLVLFLRAAGQVTTSNWYPYSLVYAADRFAPFPIFARAESLAYFMRLAPVLNVPNLETLKERVTALATRSSQMFGFRGLPLDYLTNVKHLCVVT